MRETPAIDTPISSSRDRLQTIAPVTSSAPLAELADQLLAAPVVRSEHLAPNERRGRDGTVDLPTGSGVFIEQDGC
jgi:hypothetical protein